MYGAVPGDAFGSSVALSGDGSTLVVGAPGYSDYTGAVYTFSCSGEGRYCDTTAVSTLTNPTDSWWSDFGRSLSLSENGAFLVVGDPSADFDVGRVYAYACVAAVCSAFPVFNVSICCGASQPSRFGHSVALSSDGSKLVVGAPLVQQSNGAVYVFSCNGGTSCGDSQHGDYIILSSPVPYVQFGYSVAVSKYGNVVVAGVSSAQAGMSYVFACNVTFCGLNATLSIATCESCGFGKSVAVSGNGKTVVVGTSSFSQSSGPGAAYIYRSDCAESGCS